jgi:hypothetical protein
MQQMAQAQNTKWRAEHNRERPAEKQIDAGIGMKQIMNGLVQQAPIGVIEQRDGQKNPCPAKIALEEEHRQDKKLPDI